MSAVETHYRDASVLLGALRDALAARGQVKNEKQTGFDALCPCHDDTRPSLHVEQGERGIVIACRACSAGAADVLDRLGIPDPYMPERTLTVAGLFYEQSERAPTASVDVKRSRSTTKTQDTATVSPITEAKTKAKAKAKARKVTQVGSSVSEADRQRLLDARDVLDRLDAERCIDRDIVGQTGLGLSTDGRIVLPTYDRDGEPAPRLWVAFRDDRSDDRRKMWGPKGSSPDLYPRPETPAFADGSPVLIVEGEADAIVAIAHGVQAIGCPGTGMWEPDDAERFSRFARVTIIADADTEGRRFAADVERDLRSAGVRVSVRDFGDRVPKGYDLTDYALRCRSEGVDLASAIERLPMIVAGSQVTDLFGDPEPAQVASVGADLFYPGSTHVLYGPGAVGKTYLFLVAAREEIRRGGRVLFVDYETGARTIRRRLDALGFTDEEKTRFVHLDVKGGRARPLDGDPEPTAAYLDTFAPSLIGVDSWSSVHGAGNFGDVKDDEPVERVLAQVFRPLTRDDAAVVVLDHVPKGSEAAKGYPFGSQRKQSGSHVVIEAKSSGAGRVKLLSHKDNVGDRPAGGAHIATYTFGDDFATILPVDPSEAKSATAVRDTFRPTGYMERVSDALQGAGPEGLSATALQDIVGGKQPMVRAARDVLVAEGFVERNASDASGQPFTTTHFVSVKPYREADDVAAQ